MKRLPSTQATAMKLAVPSTCRAGDRTLSAHICSLLLVHIIRPATGSKGQLAPRRDRMGPHTHVIIVAFHS